MSIFQTGNELTVITRGPGNLRLLSWQSNSGGSNTVGAIPTSNAGITKYLISFSHHYERFAFYWDGAGEAVYQIGDRLERRPVGRNWNSASTVNWGASQVTTSDVASIAAGAVNRDRVTTAFIIPDAV